MIQKIRAAGVVGAGGAGFPTHIKLNAKAKWLILNAAECEPLLRVDQQLCTSLSKELVRLMVLVGEQLGAEHLVIGIKAKHDEAVKRLKQASEGGKVSVFPLDDFYPAGDEQILVAEISGKVVPELGIPLKVDTVVMNVETLLNIGRAMEGKAVTHTCLTITGEVPTPVTLWLPIGTSYREALTLAGISPTQNLSNMSAIDGGPMMGKVITDFSEPVTKVTKGIILLPSDHLLIQRKTVSVDRARRISRTACEQCRMCTDLCPRYLIGHNMQPHKMMRKVSYTYERLEDATIAQLCCECNLCELYACPVNLPPKTINVLYKGLLAKEGIKHQACETPEMRSTRPYRKTPVKRLIYKLGLKSLDRPAPLSDGEYHPEVVCIPLKQHIGAPSCPVVQVGDRVLMGQLIADVPEGTMGASVHASINGCVVEISDRHIKIKIG